MLSKGSNYDFLLYRRNIKVKGNGEKQFRVYQLGNSTADEHHEICI